MKDRDLKLLQAGKISLVCAKRRRYLGKRGRAGEVRWSHELNSYVREKQQ